MGVRVKRDVARELNIDVGVCRRVQSNYDSNNKTRAISNKPNNVNFKMLGWALACTVKSRGSLPARDSVVILRCVVNSKGSVK